jgi:ribosomal protein S18 acetylase RimI-like enzyme
MVSRPSPEVRRATLDDVDDLVLLWIRSRDEAGGATRALAGGSADQVRSRIQEAVDVAGVMVLVAFVDRAAAGFAVVRRAPLMPVVDEPTLHVENLYVAPDLRRRGVAKALLSAVAGLAERHGIEQVVVNAPPSSRDANRFLARLGFTPLVVRRLASTATLRRHLSGESRRGGLDDLLSRRRSLRARTERNEPTVELTGEVTPREGIAARLRLEARRARRIDGDQPGVELVDLDALALEDAAASGDRRPAATADSTVANAAVHVTSV